MTKTDTSIDNSAELDCIDRHKITNNDDNIKTDLNIFLNNFNHFDSLNCSQRDIISQQKIPSFFNNNNNIAFNGNDIYEISSTTLCSICNQSQITTNRQTFDCSHLVCQSCLLQYNMLEQNGNDSKCPICSNKIQTPLVADINSFISKYSILDETNHHLNMFNDQEQSSLSTLLKPNDEKLNNQNGFINSSFISKMNDSETFNNLIKCQKCKMNSIFIIKSKLDSTDQLESTEFNSLKCLECNTFLCSQCIQEHQYNYCYLSHHLVNLSLKNENIFNESDSNNNNSGSFLETIINNNDDNVSQSKQQQQQQKSRRSIEIEKKIKKTFSYFKKLVEERKEFLLKELNTFDQLKLKVIIIYLSKNINFPFNNSSYLFYF
jgi:hypothetical protein